jgi:hypothetical protein
VELDLRVIRNGVMEMSRYTCEKTKDEILDIIADEFDKINKDYDNAMQNDNEKLKERNQGRYVAMFDLLHKLEIYEK